MVKHKDAGTTPSADQVAVYRWLASHEWQLDLGRAAADLELSQSAVAEGVARSVEVGLLEVDPDDPATFRPVDPDLVAASVAGSIEEEIRDRTAELRELHNGFGVLRSQYMQSRRRNAEMIAVIPSMDQVRAALNLASEECRQEILACQPGGNRDPAVLEEAIARDVKNLERGIRMRTLYHHTARFNGPSQAYVAAVSKLGAEYRTAHTLFGRLIVFDRAVAFLPERRGTWGAVVVREPSVVEYLCDIFEQAWERAQPFADAAGDGLENVAREVDHTILRLLAAGLKDETIARRLGMSLRTARKHVADIMRELQAESRFQAGYNAGLLDLLSDG